MDSRNWDDPDLHFYFMGRKRHIKIGLRIRFCICDCDYKWFSRDDMIRIFMNVWAGTHVLLRVNGNTYSFKSYYDCSRAPESLNFKILEVL
jgi:hypothetical protein